MPLPFCIIEIGCNDSFALFHLKEAASLLIFIKNGTSGEMAVKC